VVCSLEPFAPFFKSRYEQYLKWVKTIDETEGGIDKFSRGWQGENGMVRLSSSIISMLGCLEIHHASRRVGGDAGSKE
jgi:hypothetical protein